MGGWAVVWAAAWGGMAGGMGGMGRHGRNGRWHGRHGVWRWYGWYGGGMFAVSDDARKAAPKSSQSAPQVERTVQSAEIVAQLSSNDLKEDAVVELKLKLAELVNAELAEAKRAVAAKNSEASKKHFDNIIEMISHALREGQPLPWMYEALSFRCKLMSIRLRIFVEFCCRQLTFRATSRKG